LFSWVFALHHAAKKQLHRLAFWGFPRSRPGVSISDSRILFIIHAVAPKSVSSEVNVGRSRGS
jgi:hypothetical protein